MLLGLAIVWFSLYLFFIWEVSSVTILKMVGYASTLARIKGGVDELGGRQKKYRKSWLAGRQMCNRSRHGEPDSLGPPRMEMTA
ncbi:hypothetical protein GMSM_19080 [Geomonas sp. Red276]